MLLVAASMCYAAPTKPKKAQQPAGGANQVGGLKGKVGDWLYDGRWKIQVLSAREASSYTLTLPCANNQDYSAFNESADFDSGSNTFSAKSGYAFVVVPCLLKNAQTSAQQFDAYDSKTNAVTDDAGGSYPPIAFDMLMPFPWNSKVMLPGSGIKMTVIFAIPQGTNVQDLIITLRDWFGGPTHNVRVSLTGALLKS